MSFRHFKNAKAARRHISHIYLNILAVNCEVKLSYLWDAFDANLDEIKAYLQELSLTNEINTKLTVVGIGGTLFVLHLDRVHTYFNQVLRSGNVQVIDVSNHHDVPVLVTMERKTKVLNSIVDSYYHYISLGCNNNYETGENVADGRTCNMTTLFGALLGYPVLYWYEHEEQDSTCLSMLPLKVHKLLASVRQNTTSKQINPLIQHHELYSFSIPKMLSKEMEQCVRIWMQKLLCANQSSVFENMHLVSNTITLPIVVL